jgi:chaperonin GroES
MRLAVSIDECQDWEYTFGLSGTTLLPRMGCFATSLRAPENQHNNSENTMKFRPLHDRVVVKRIVAEDKSAGGIIIPDSAKEKPSQAEIIAVGPGGRDENGKLIPIDLKTGEVVLFGKWSGTEVKIDGVDYLIMKESDIMGVLDQSIARKKAA